VGLPHGLENLLSASFNDTIRDKSNELRLKKKEVSSIKKTWGV